MNHKEIAQSIIDSLGTSVLDGYRNPERLGEFRESERWDACSHAEKVLLDLARGLWSGSRGEFTPMDALARLDDENMARYVVALMLARSDKVQHFVAEAMVGHRLLDLIEKMVNAEAD